MKNKALKSLLFALSLGMVITACNLQSAKRSSSLSAIKSVISEHQILMDKVIEKGFSEEHLILFANMGLTYDEILALSLEEAENLLKDWQKQSYETAVQSLHENWQDWQSTAETDTNFVFVTSNETININSLDKWVEDFQNGRPSVVYAGAFGNPTPLAYYLVADGTSEYTIYYYFYENTYGTFVSDTVYKRHFDYVFGDIDINPYKRCSLNRIPISLETLDNSPYDEITKAEMLKIAQKEVAILSGADVADKWLSRPAEALMLYGEDKPYQVIEFFEDGDSMKKDDHNGNRLAISYDCKRIAIQSMVDGSWSALSDYEQEVIKKK